MIKTRIFSKLQELFGIDLRSLALFRIGLGLLLLFDLIFRAIYLRAHYTDFGILPRSVLLEKFALPGHLSLHLINGSTAFQALLFFIAGIFALFLLVGYRTRLATLVSWFLLISLHSRNEFVLQGGDVFFRVLLFWGLFLPLGACYSVDRKRKTNPEVPSRPFVSAATVALLLQVCFVYWFTALLKTSPIWWKDGSAIYYALNIDQLARPLAHELLQHPQLVTCLTFATIWLERLGPLLAFVPFFTGPLRTLTVFLFIGFHFSMNLFLKLGPFPYICMVAWLVFLPSWFWNKILRISSTQAGTAEQNAGIKIYKSIWVNFLAVLFLAYIFMWNLRTTDFPKYSKVFPESFNVIGEIFRVDQKWSMFSPFPVIDDGWYVIPGKLKDGTEIDLFSEGPNISWEKPKNVADMYHGERWRKYMMNLWDKANADHRLYYARYRCRAWNSTHQDGKLLDTFQIYFMREDTLPDHGTAPVEKVLLWNHRCFGGT